MSLVVEEDAVSVSVLDISGNEVCAVSLERRQKINALKVAIQEKTGIAILDQKILLDGEQLRTHDVVNNVLGAHQEHSVMLVHMGLSSNGAQEATMNRAANHIALALRRKQARKHAEAQQTTETASELARQDPQGVPATIVQAFLQRLRGGRERAVAASALQRRADRPAPAQAANVPVHEDPQDRAARVAQRLQRNFRARRAAAAHLP
eukprot:TRINITY_DN21480_c0_g1_i2.p1 TRINITY_DN21480_c0_g1~~TRINITY_DN21480_c0_g1_i2.p1  ORF type:complete len:208 (+),score=33.64 TRINITY_DN21480_c0_g1_i2:345-968(+)